MADHGESAAPPRALVVIPARLATPLRRGNGLREPLPWHWVTLERQVRTDRQVLDMPSTLPHSSGGLRVLLVVQVLNLHQPRVWRLRLAQSAGGLRATHGAAVAGGRKSNRASSPAIRLTFERL